MRKLLPKLLLRKEALRALSGMDLARIGAGQGDDAGVALEPTGGKVCPVAALV